MQEVKAYIRCSKVEDVIEGLRELGIENMTVIDVMALGKGMVDPRHYKYSIECVEKYSEVAKLEIICSDSQAPLIMNTIRTKAYTGEPGDGLIAVSRIESAIKVRTGVKVS
jgi:nitrogen regulatory protein PII